MYVNVYVYMCIYNICVYVYVYVDVNVNVNVYVYVCYVICNLFHSLKNMFTITALLIRFTNKFVYILIFTKRSGRWQNQRIVIHKFKLLFSRIELNYIIALELCNHLLNISTLSCLHECLHVFM